MKKLLFSCDDALHKKLKAYAKQEERSVLWVIRKALKNFLNNQNNAEGNSIQQGSKGQGISRS